MVDWERKWDGWDEHDGCKEPENSKIVGTFASEELRSWGQNDAMNRTG
jgi:hypothetical protein